SSDHAKRGSKTVSLGGEDSKDDEAKKRKSDENQRDSDLSMAEAPTPAKSNGTQSAATAPAKPNGTQSATNAPTPAKPGGTQSASTARAPAKPRRAQSLISFRCPLEPKIEPLDEDDRAASAFVDNNSTFSFGGRSHSMVTRRMSLGLLKPKPEPVDGEAPCSSNRFVTPARRGRSTTVKGPRVPKQEPDDEDDAADDNEDGLVRITNKLFPSSLLMLPPSRIKLSEDRAKRLRSSSTKRPRAPKTGPPLDDDDAMTMLSCPLDRPPPQR
ncbi:hypothetical protein PMAYCL1PPCAC_25676, partial [Pristionchus mayeri]